MSWLGFPEADLSDAAGSVPREDWSKSEGSKTGMGKPRQGVIPEKSHTGWPSLDPQGSSGI